MQQILQAKLNILLEENKLSQQINEKRQITKAKVKQTNSNSLYQEPSTKMKIENSKHIHFQKSRSTEHMDDSVDNQSIFSKRFNFLEHQRAQNLSLNELLVEKQYLKRILEKIYKKVNQLTESEINRHISQSRFKIENDSKLKHSTSMNIQESKKQSDLHEASRFKKRQPFKTKQQLNHSRINLLNKELNHLKNQKMKFMLPKIRQTQPATPIKVIEKNQYQQLQYEQVQVMQNMVKQKKKEIISLKNEIEKYGKNLIKEEGIKNQRRHVVALQQKQNNQASASISEDIADLQYELQSKRRKLQQKQRYLQVTVEDLTELNNKINKINLQIQSKYPSLQSTPQKNYGKSKFKESQQTIILGHSVDSFSSTSTSPLSQQQKYQFLLRKKQVFLKSKQAQNSKWKNIYNQKMRRLINECTNITDMQTVSHKLEDQNKHKDQEYSWLLQKSNKNYHQL